MMRTLMTKTLFVLSILLSAQALAFDVDGLSYDVINTTDVEVTGRASGNTATDIVIPATASDSGTTYSVTTIGYRAFSDNALTSVIIPDSVTTIVEGAFFINALTSVIIPDGVTTIGYGAFNVNALTSVIIPDSVTTIGWAAFYQNDLTSVIIGSSVTAIGDSAFAENALTSVIIPDSVTTIGLGAFYNNALTSVIIPYSVTKIGQAAFADNALTSVAFEGDFGSFGRYIFSGNLLTRFTITYCIGTTGWPQYFNNGSTIITSTPVDCSTAPEAPTIDSIAAGNGEAIINFTPGADNRSPITGYRYIRDDGSVSSSILGTTGLNPYGIALDAAGNVYTANVVLGYRV